MAVTRLSVDSVEELSKEKSKAELQAENEQLQAKVDLLEGCVMELAEKVYSE